MESLISVIVPIYKVEKYIYECINSIINQTYKNLEIILVDDDSPDNCGKICDEYAESDKRVKVIHKTNGGLSDARNAALKISTGEYLVFVDSDDYMPIDGIEYLYKLAIENDADIVIGGTEKFNDEFGEIIWTSCTNKGNVKIYTKEEAMQDVLMNGCAAWARMYKREVHINTYFPIGEINEDEAIVLELLEKCNKIVKSDRIVYRYRYRPESITSTNFNVNKLAWYGHCKSNLEFIKRKYPSLMEYAEKRYYSSLIWCLNNMTEDKNRFKKYIMPLRKELKSTFKKFINNQYIDKKEKFRGFCLAYVYYLYAAIVKILGKHYT